MKRIQVAAAILLFSLHATAVVDYSNVTGSLGVIKAFQALHTGNINLLVEALGQRPSPINEGFSIQTSQGEVRMRLIQVAPLTKNEQMLRLMIAAGARVSATDSLGRNAVHYLSNAVPELSHHFGYHPTNDGWWSSQMLAILAEAGVAIDGTDDTLRQPIHYAASMGARTLLGTLVTLGAPLDPIDIEGKSPVQLAANHFHLDTVDFLKSRGAKTEVNFSDYLIGGKNRAFSFLYDHPMGVSIAVATVFALKLARSFCGRYLARTNSPQSSPRPPVRPNVVPGLPPVLDQQPQQPSPRSPRDDGLEKKSKARDAGALAGGVGLAAALLPHGQGPLGLQQQAPGAAGPVVAQAQGPVVRAAAPAQAVQAVQAEQPVKAAKAEKAAAKPAEAPKSRLRQLREARERANGARDGNNPQEALDALVAAEALLENFKGTQLDQGEAEEKRHLLAAIHGINVKLKDGAVQGRANVVYDKFIGKLKKRR